MRFRQSINENMRLLILQLLAESDGYSVNSQILQSALADFGHHPSFEAIKNELAWLEAKALIECVQVGTAVVAEILQAGKDVADGRSMIDGVSRPGPKF